MSGIATGVSSEVGGGRVASGPPLPPSSFVGGGWEESATARRGKGPLGTVSPSCNDKGKMASVKDLMKTEVETVSPETSVADLVDLLDRAGITGVPVVDGDEALVGIVSVRDVLHLAREMGEVPEAMRWGMARSASPQETGFLDPPVEGEFFAYYVTPGGGFVDVRSRIQEVPDKLFDGYTVADIMTTDPVIITPEAEIRELASLLRERKIHRVLVVDNGQLAGIVTTSDILDHLAGS